MIAKLLPEHHLEFLGLKEGCTDSSESTHVKMPHCWKSHVAAHFFVFSESQGLSSISLNTLSSISLNTFTSNIMFAA